MTNLESNGKEFMYDAGRGGSRKTDYCDYIYCVWRPEQQYDLAEDERARLQGQFKIKLTKNRHGPSSDQVDLALDANSLRIFKPKSITP